MLGSPVRKTEGAVREGNEKRAEDRAAGAGKRESEHRAADEEPLTLRLGREVRRLDRRVRALPERTGGAGPAKSGADRATQKLASGGHRRQHSQGQGTCQLQAPASAAVFSYSDPKEGFCLAKTEHSGLAGGGLSRQAALRNGLAAEPAVRRHFFETSGHYSDPAAAPPFVVCSDGGSVRAQQVDNKAAAEFD